MATLFARPLAVSTIAPTSPSSLTSKSPSNASDAATAVTTSALPTRHLPFCSPGPHPASRPQLHTPPSTPPDSISSSKAITSRLHPVERFDRIVSDPPIYAITSEALSQAYAHLASQPLPATQQVFPWLHGLHPDNYFQLGFFGARRASHRRTPSCLRTMTVVKTGGDLSHSKLKGAIAPEEILKVSDGPIGPEDDGPVFTPDFLDNDPREGFGVRNFQIQTAKLATVSDIVVYADPSATQTEIVSVAMTISQAQERWANRLDRSESETTRQFNTFILIDDFPTFQERCPHLVAVGSDGCLTGQVMDFFHRERYEMYTMSTATEIANNVWLGPTPDPTLDGSAENQSDRPEFDILIGCHDGAAMPRGVHFKLAERQLEQRESCSSGDKDNVVDDLEFPASGAILPPTWGNDEVGRLLDTCRWIHNQANRRSLKRRRDSKFSAGRDRPFSSSSSSGGVPDADGDRPMTASQDNIKDNQSSGRQVLIHCYDGYTESSLLALAYYMFAHGVRVHDAWLQLHRERGRNFFAYPSDVQLLRVVEHCILFASPACKPNNSTSVPSSPCASPSLSDTTSPPLTPSGTSSFSADAATTNDRVSKCVSSVNQKLSAIPSYTSSPTPAWLDKMDGSLPSRILPYMYLGNLAHANNPSLLKAMGIGQVLSVGENINWTRLVTPTEDEASDDDEHGQENGEYNGWLRESLRFVDGVQDNGVDPLMEELVKCLDFIENGRKQGIATLVHCRVGVSRSATICIAHVMAALDLSFPRAYCFVRARRLNVIIQPHLRFVYELLKWEEFLGENRHKREQQDRDVDDDGNDTAPSNDSVALLPPRRELEWASVAREIAAMNKPYAKQ